MYIRRSWAIAAVVLTFLLTCESAFACIMPASRDLNDVKYADVVVVGRVINYKIIRDEEFRNKMLAYPKLTPE